MKIFRWCVGLAVVARRGGTTQLVGVLMNITKFLGALTNITKVLGCVNKFEKLNRRMLAPPAHVLDEGHSWQVLSNIRSDLKNI